VHARRGKQANAHRDHQIENDEPQEHERLQRKE
jgi:hypothetical protein